jgi:hypothetical protein
MAKIRKTISQRTTTIPTESSSEFSMTSPGESIPTRVPAHELYGVESRAWYDSLEPLEFTSDERTDLAAWRQKVKEYTIANMHKGIEGLAE